MVEGIAFYALYKSRVLIIPCKADGYKKSFKDYNSLQYRSDIFSQCTNYQLPSPSNTYSLGFS